MNKIPERILIIPDMHEEWELTQFVLDKYEKKTDLTIFLGDYLDSWDYNHNHKDHFIGLMKWMKETFSSDRRLGLIGNHDIQYFAEMQEYCCSGFFPWKVKYIDEYLGRNFWQKLNFVKFMKVNGNKYSFAHGGIHPSHLPFNFELNEENFTRLNAQMKMSVVNRTVSPLLNAGRCRGGWQNVGGVTWLDFTHEFEEIDDLIQIVGHTGKRTIRTIGKSMCIDCYQKYVMILNTVDNTHEIVDVNLAYNIAKYMPEEEV